jgi:hypothetical protein
MFEDDEPAQLPLDFKTFFNSMARSFLGVGIHISVWRKSYDDDRSDNQLLVDADFIVEEEELYLAHAMSEGSCARYTLIWFCSDSAASTRVSAFFL